MTGARQMGIAMRHAGCSCMALPIPHPISCATAPDPDHPPNLHLEQRETVMLCLLHLLQQALHQRPESRPPVLRDQGLLANDLGQDNLRGVLTRCVNGGQRTCCIALHRIAAKAGQLTSMSLSNVKSRRSMGFCFITPSRSYCKMIPVCACVRSLRPQARPLQTAMTCTLPI